MTILTTIACFGPLSVIGLVHFLTARTEKNTGDYEAAMKHKSSAKRWSMFACILGLFITIAIVLCCVFFAHRYGLVRFAVVKPVDYPHNPAAVRYISDGANYPHHASQVIYGGVGYRHNPSMVLYLSDKTTDYPHDPNQVIFLSDKTTDYPHKPNQVVYLPDRTTDYQHHPDQVKYQPDGTTNYPHNRNQVQYMPEGYAHHPEDVEYVNPHTSPQPLIPRHPAPSNDQI